jgi:hypothetical protein
MNKATSHVLLEMLFNVLDNMFVSRAPIVIAAAVACPTMDTEDSMTSREVFVHFNESTFSSFCGDHEVKDVSV